MSDRLVRGLLPSRGLRIIHCRVTDTARIARMLHAFTPTTARLFAESLAAGLLVASLQKGQSRVNLQIECDGPVRGLFIDADPDGNVRGYVRAPHVHFPGDPAAGVRAALGGSGYLSILRDLGSGNFYRGQVELRDMDVAKDLSRFFTESEQILTALDIVVTSREDEPIGDAAALLVQKLPDGDDGFIDTVRQRLVSGGYRSALARGASTQDAIATVVGEGFELLADLEVAYRCACSLQRVRVAVSALGVDGIRQVLSKERQVSVTCEFCLQRYVLEEADLRDLMARLEQAQPGEG